MADDADPATSRAAIAPVAGPAASARADRLVPADADKLNVFISYSRADITFADELVAGLEVLGFRPTIDRHSIVEGEDWKKRLGGLIADSDTVVFVLSPDSAKSPICAWEVDEAVKLSKRILPVLWRPTGDIRAPEKLAALNYVRFDPNDDGKQRSFMAGLKALARALETDLDWLREHTRLLARALEWDKGRPANRLLSGDDIAKAKDWIARRPRNAPEPTPLHLDFVKASENWETERQSEAQRQLAERERLVREAEAAVKRAADAELARKRTRRMLAWGAAAAVLLIVAGIAGFAMQQADNAFRQAQLLAQAVEQRQRADATRNAALLSQSKYLADISRQVLEVEKDPGTALLLALEALPDQNSPDEITRTRPYWDQAEVSLEAARRLLRENATLIAHAGPITSVAVTPDGARIVTGSADDTAKVWDARTFAELATLKGHASLVRSVAVSPDGARIVTGSDDSTAKVWDARTFAELATLKGHTDPVSSVAVSPDGARIVTGSHDRTARVWDARTFAELAVLKGTGRVTSVAVTADGARIVTGSDDRTARVWEIFPSGQALVAEAQQIAPRCLTTEQRQRFHLTAARPRWCDTMQKWPYDVVTIANAAASAAREHIGANRHREAIAGLEQTIARTPATAARLAPPLAQAHDGIAWNAFLDVVLRGKPADTLRDVLADADKAIALAPEARDILDTRAHIRLALGRTDEALADFDKAISLGLNHIGTWTGRGRAHEAKGNRDLSIADYRRALALDPGGDAWTKHAHAQARAGLERLGAAP